MRFDYRNLNTQQEVLDAAKQYFLQGKGRCGVQVPSGFRCFYKREDGYTCPIGAFIPDEIYDSSFESKNSVQLMRILPDGEFKKWVMKNSLILMQLQKMHDLGRCWNEDGSFKEILYLESVHRLLTFEY